MFLMYSFIIVSIDITYCREVDDKLKTSFYNCQNFSRNPDKIFNEMRQEKFDSVFSNGKTKTVVVTVDIAQTINFFTLRSQNLHPYGDVTITGGGL